MIRVRMWYTIFRRFKLFGMLVESHVISNTRLKCFFLSDFLSFYALLIQHAHWSTFQVFHSDESIFCATKIRCVRKLSSRKKSSVFAIAFALHTHTYRYSIATCFISFWIFCRSWNFFFYCICCKSKKRNVKNKNLCHVWMI